MVSSPSSALSAFPPYAPPRHDWTTAEIEAWLTAPFFTLLDQARAVHRHWHDETMQLASLLSIKTGGCPEDCGYCPQSAHHAKKDSDHAGVDLTRTPLMDVESVLSHARHAQTKGATRFCMGAAWRSVRDGAPFDAVLAMVRGVRALGMEACVTLGMLTQSQAQRLAEAGLTAYNHNLDTSPEFYGKIISTRTVEDRLATIAAVRDAGITVCCGGIVGMGESVRDRARLIEMLAAMTPHPESVPINALVAVEGTPLADQPPVDPLDLVRMCAVARIVIPQARVRLSAGRKTLSREAQTLCFFAGVNAIFYGDTLLTTPNTDAEDDLALLNALGLKMECEPVKTCTSIGHNAAA